MLLVVLLFTIFPPSETRGLKPHMWMPPVCYRSPSPEPIYSSDGKRMNTREYRTRKKLEEERHDLIQKMFKVNPEFKPPPDYK
jgi:Splicing factor (branch point binding protein)